MLRQRMRLLRRSSVLVLVAACRPSGPSTTPDAATVPDAARSTPPPFLAVDADLDALHPLRVRMIRAGSLRLEREGKPVNDPENRAVAVDARLLEPDDFGTPSVPRILCEENGYRIAAYVERDDLAIVTARTVQVMTTPPREHAGAPLPPSTPGVLLRAGTAVRVEGGLDGDVARVRYERTGIRVAGFVRRDDVGIGYTPDASTTSPAMPDARLLVQTSFFGAPGGQPIAEIDPRLGLATAPAKTLGIERSDHVLLHYDNGELTLVGWVPTKSIERGPQAMPSIRMTSRGAGPSEGAAVKLARGTILRGGPLRGAVGVVTADAQFRCVGDCDGEHPRIEVAACTDVVEVFAD